MLWLRQDWINTNISPHKTEPLCKQMDEKCTKAWKGNFHWNCPLNCRCNLTQNEELRRNYIRNLARNWDLPPNYICNLTPNEYLPQNYVANCNAIAMQLHLQLHCNLHVKTSQWSLFREGPWIFLSLPAPFTLPRASEVGSPTNHPGSRQRQDTGPGILSNKKLKKKNGLYITLFVLLHVLNVLGM